MEDPTGLGKIAENVAKLGDSKLPNKAYDDLLADPMRQTGKAMVDVAKTFRLFLAPFQLAAAWQDRFEKWLDRIRNAVPEARQQEAPASIAGPVIRSLLFMEDDNLLTELYLNLLARAIDKERCSEAHPAFVKIIEQLSPDEAMVMYWFGNRDSWVRPPLSEQGAETTFPRESLIYPENFSIYAEHLGALNLVKLPMIIPATVLTAEGVEAPRQPEYAGNSISITRFGKRFVEACIPEDFDLTKFRGDQPDASD